MTASIAQINKEYSNNVINSSDTLTRHRQVHLLTQWCLWAFDYMYHITGCDSHFRNPVVFNILKEPLLVQKQTLHQQKVLDLSFNLAPWKWAWHYHEASTPSCPKITFFTSRAPMLFAARGRGALLISPRPLSGCQIKAEIMGCLLMYRLFLY